MNQQLHIPSDSVRSDVEDEDPSPRAGGQQVDQPYQVAAKRAQRHGPSCRLGPLRRNGRRQDRVLPLRGQELVDVEKPLVQFRATITASHVALLIAWRWHRASGRLPDRHRARSLGSLWMRQKHDIDSVYHFEPSGKRPLAMTRRSVVPSGHDGVHELPVQRQS